MNPKPFKHIEDKIRAAAGAEPEFDEQAWNRMQTLLDKEDEKSRPLAWIWFLAGILILGTAAILWPNQQQKTTIPNYTITEQGTIDHSKQTNSPAETQSEKQTRDEVAMGSSNDSLHTIAEPAVTASQTVVQAQTINLISIHKNTVQKNPYTTSIPKQNTTVSGQFVGDEKNNNPVINQQESGEKVGSRVEPGLNQNEDHKEIQTSPELPIIVSTDSLRDILSRVTSKEKTKLNDPDQEYSRFYFLAQTGLEFSGAKFMQFQGAKSDMRFGLGIGYRISNRWSIQTGFSGGHKKYIAGDGDYKMPDDPYWNNTQLVSIDADCYVFEIPLLVRYDFKNTKRINYFAIGGLSSMLMKSEDYQYAYYHIGNPYLYHADRTYTGNTHVFSNLQFAVGIDKKIGSLFSIQAAPYLSLPLQGVGEGQVNLFSTGVQIGLKFTPQKQ